MQTTLLGFALALIAVILAAFAAPFFIDWNEWRPQLEAQASALAGSRVIISGNIDLTLLPTPAFVLRNVSLGDADNGTGMRAAEMRGSLSLPALLSGKIEASEFVVSRPAIRLVVGKDGRLLLPAGAGAGQEISVSGFVLEAGSLTIEDRRTNSFFLADDFSARGELLSREGPFRLDGGFRLNGMRWILRAGGSRFGPDHAGKIRLVMERPADAVLFEAEGLFSLSAAAARFEGKVVAAQRSGALPWRISSDANGDVSELRFTNLELALGQSELPITLSGEAKLIPHAGGSLEVTLSSKRIDLDLGDPKAATAGAGYVLPRLFEARELLSALPLPARLVFSADGILAGGQLARDVRAILLADKGVTTLERFEAKLPGRSSFDLAGKNDGKEFSGPLTFESEEPQIFMRWLLGEELSAKLSLRQTLRLKGTLAYRPEELSVLDFQALAENTKIGGKFALQGLRDGQAVLVADLEAERVNFDTLLPLAKSFSDVSGDLRFNLNLRATNSLLLDKSLRRLSLAATRTATGFEVQNLSIDDLDGLNLTAKRAKGEIEFSAEALRADGLLALLQYFSGSADFAAILSKYVSSRYPIRATGTLAPIKGGRRVLLKSGDAELALDLGDFRDTRWPVDAVLRLPDTEISANGHLRLGADGRFEPAIALNLKSSDLRRAFVLVDRAAASALPANGSFILSRDGNNFVFDKISLEFSGSRGQGRIVIPAGELSPYSGQLTFDRADAAALLSLAIGRAHVSYAELGVPLLANFPGTLKVEVGSLAVSEQISLQKAAFQIRAGRYETVFDDFQAQLAGGKLSGSLRVADTFPRVLEIKLDAADVSVSQLLAAKTLRGILRGSFALSSNGNMQDELVSNLSGQGSLQVTNFELDKTDATSVSTVYAAPAVQMDEKKIEQALLSALERAPLKVSKLESPVVVTNGVFRSGSAKAQAGNIEIALSGSFNLPKRMVEALLSIEVAGNASTRPGATLRWAGPFDGPERKVDARALITAITLREIERGGQNPSNTNLPQEERLPAKKKRTPAKSDIDTAPLLPPPANIPPAPQPRSQN